VQSVSSQERWEGKDITVTHFFDVRGKGCEVLLKRVFESTGVLFKPILHAEVPREMSV
jgi:hypothetical protein